MAGGKHSTPTRAWRGQAKWRTENKFIYLRLNELKYNGRDDKWFAWIPASKMAVRKRSVASIKMQMKLLESCLWSILMKDSFQVSVSKCVVIFWLSFVSARTSLQPCVSVLMVWRIQELRIFTRPHTSSFHLAYIWKMLRKILLSGADTIADISVSGQFSVTGKIFWPLWNYKYTGF